MFSYEIGLNKFNRGYLDSLLKDLPDDELDLQPHTELHSARWILVHFAISADYAFSMTEMPSLCPKAWHKAYGPSSQPGTDGTVKPTRAELLAAINDGYIREHRHGANGTSCLLHWIWPVSTTILNNKL